MCSRPVELAPAWRGSARESRVWELAWELAPESGQVLAPALASEWRPVLPWQTKESRLPRPEVKTRRLTSLKTCLCTRHRTAQRECKAPIRPWLGDVSCPLGSSGARVPHSRAVVNSSQPQMPRLPSRQLNRGRPAARPEVQPALSHRFADEAGSRAGLVSLTNV